MMVLAERLVLSLSSVIGGLGFDPSIVSQIGRVLVRVLLSRSVRSPFVGFVSVMYKSVVCKAPVVVYIC